MTDTDLPRTTIALVFDDEHERYHVSVAVGDNEYPLGSYATASEAGASMRKWVDDRGLRFGRDSARRLDRAQRENAQVLVLDVIPDDEPLPKPRREQ